MIYSEVHQGQGKGLCISAQPGSGFWEHQRLLCSQHGLPHYGKECSFKKIVKYFLQGLVFFKHLGQLERDFQKHQRPSLACLVKSTDAKTSADEGSPYYIVLTRALEYLPKIL